MERLPPLKALRVFQVAAELGSFKLAADKLHVTQAAISQQIRLLEEYFDEALFVRLNREVQLTPAAMTLLPYLQKAFELINEGARTFSQDPNPDQLKITTIASFAARWLVPRLNGFQRETPELSCYVSTTDAVFNFSDSSQDIAIRFSPGGTSGLHEVLLSTDYVLPLCHPTLLEQQTDKQLPLLIDDSSDIREVNASFIELFGGDQHVALKMRDSSILIDAALNGQGIAAVRYSLAMEQIKHGLLMPARPIYWNSPYSYYLVAPEAFFKRPKVAAFIQWVMAEAKVIEEHWHKFCAEQHLKHV